MAKVKYVNLLPPSVKNRVVTIKLELAELAESVSGAGDIVYFLTEVSPGWVTDILEASDLGING